jgi:MFS family permease
VGPLVGGLLLVTNGYLTLFLLDAITSIIMAVIVIVALPETKPEQPASQAHETFFQTLKGYRVVAADGLYMAFLGILLLVQLVYVQMNSTLSVYLRNAHGITPDRFGIILSLNATMVVLFQFWITRKIARRPPMLVLLLGTTLYGIGFVMYGFVSTLPLMMAAMAIITVGEMVHVPIAQAVVADFAPASMRGRYMAMMGFSWIVPFAIGPLAAGAIMDHLDPSWVWYACGLLAALATAGCYALHLAGGARFMAGRENPNGAAPPAEAVATAGD